MITTEPTVIPGMVHYPAGNPRKTAYEIRVGPAPSGTGTFKLTNANLKLGEYDGDDPDDPKVAGNVDGTNDSWELVTNASPNFLEYEYLAYSKQLLGNITFTYTAKGDMEKGATIRIDRADSSGGEPEFTDFSHGGTTGVLDVVSGPAEPITGDITPYATVKTNAVLDAGRSIVLRYSNITVPELDDVTKGSVRRYAFLAWATSPMSIIDPAVATERQVAHGGSVAVLGVAAGEDGSDVSDDSPEVITVTAPHGTGEMALTGRGIAVSTDVADVGTTLNQAVAGEDLDNLIFTFTAKGGMAIGSKVEVDIPSAWGDIFPDNVNDDSSPGEIRPTVDTLTSADFTAANGLVTLTTTAELADTGTLVFSLTTESGAGSGYKLCLPYEGEFWHTRYA